MIKILPLQQKLGYPEIYETLLALTILMLISFFQGVMISMIHKSLKILLKNSNLLGYKNTI